MQRGTSGLEKKTDSQQQTKRGGEARGYCSIGEGERGSKPIIPSGRDGLIQKEVIWAKTKRNKAKAKLNRPHSKRREKGKLWLMRGGGGWGGSPLLQRRRKKDKDD